MKRSTRPGPLSETQQRWQELHRRHGVLRRVIDSGRIDEADPDLHAAFPDRDDLVRALVQHWTTLIGGCVDFALEVGEENDSAETLREAHRAAMRREPSLYPLILHASRGPLGAALVEREYLRLACAVGLATPGTSGAAASHAVAVILDGVPLPGALPRMSRVRSALEWVTGPSAAAHPVQELLH
ncbi:MULTISPECIES: hypothetical protein [unclassified Nocardioides]|jgi:hypothetical protein|uniref:hypothetical protein n=1 Tax=unclassified Nocardioides TaxID=2615069 RepID=UPI0007026C62|nr:MULTISPECIES: hypothetical protein [unclassified Nocardioides]KRC52847.1 hypothetical protein ASE19_10575 [Nocardioides sp. Root79]KRC72378.1 hypothetical protein ASE20_07110 [Nocardioides sp. Root240]